MPKTAGLDNDHDRSLLDLQPYALRLITAFTFRGQSVAYRQMQASDT